MWTGFKKVPEKRETEERVFKKQHIKQMKWEHTGL